MIVLGYLKPKLTVYHLSPKVVSSLIFMKQPCCMAFLLTLYYALGQSLCRMCRTKQKRLQPKSVVATFLIASSSDEHRTMKLLLSDSLFLCRKLFQQRVDSRFQLGILAVQGVGRLVVDEHVGFQFVIFSIAAFHVDAAHLRDAEHEAGVNLRFPPDGCHRPRYGRTDELADFQRFVELRSAVCIAVVVLADEHA